MKAIDTEKLHESFEERMSVTEWFDSITSPPLEGANLQLAEIGHLLYRSIEDHRLIFDDEKDEVASAVTKGVFFGASICGAHFYWNDSEGCDVELFSPAADEVTEQIEALEAPEAINTGAWFEEVNSRFTGHGIENLEEMIRMYQYDICPKVSRQGDFRFGAQVGGYIFRVVFELERLQKEYEEAIPSDLDISITDFLNE